jgi:phosphatidylglycerophosphate synthase
MADQVRENNGLLAAAEKRLLIGIATRLPSRVTSDGLTLLALVAMVAAGAGFALARWDTRWLWLVVIGLAANWFGDSLDGTLARVRRAERPRYGFYIDHVVDLVGTTALVAGLAISGFMSPLLALSLLAAYLLVSGELFLATAVHKVFRMSFAGVGPTELRIVLALGAMALMSDPQVDMGPLGTFRLFDVGGAVAIGGLMAAFVVGTARNARALARLEPGSRAGGTARTPLRLEGTRPDEYDGSFALEGQSPPWRCLTPDPVGAARSSFAAPAHTTSRTSMSRCHRAS